MFIWLLARARIYIYSYVQVDMFENSLGLLLLRPLRSRPAGLSKLRDVVSSFVERSFTLSGFAINRFKNRKEVYMFVNVSLR